jgi:hypothetical protein
VEAETLSKVPQPVGKSPHAFRIVLGILAAAFIARLGTLLSVYRPSGWENWVGVMLAVGFFLALALGLFGPGSFCAQAGFE